MKTPPRSHVCWAVTDIEGRITALSPLAATLLGIGHEDRENLLRFFPQHRRQVVFDMQVALTGWPAARSTVLAPLAARPVAVRYLVSRRVLQPAVELHWTFDLAENLAAAS